MTTSYGIQGTLTQSTNTPTITTGLPPIPSVVINLGLVLGVTFPVAGIFIASVIGVIIWCHKRKTDDSDDESENPEDSGYERGDADPEKTGSQHSGEPHSSGLQASDELPESVLVPTTTMTRTKCREDGGKMAEKAKIES